MNTLKYFNPTTPSLRHRTQVNLSLFLSGVKGPLKALVKGHNKTGGRNNHGRLTAFNLGGGHKQSYRYLSNKYLPFAILTSIEYDPNRSAFVATAYMKETGSYHYFLAPQQAMLGSLLAANYGLRRPLPGSPCLLYFAQVGDLLYNVRLTDTFRVGSSAGTYCKLLKKELILFYGLLKTPSGCVRKVSLASLGYIGKASNKGHKDVILGKAGRSRWLGRRPCVRGVAMNPVDHPHGGGEGKTSGGRHPCSPWGKLTKGKRTRKNKLTGKFILKRRYEK